MKTELTFFWIATILYGLSALLYILSFVLKKEKLIRSGIILTWVGFLTQTLFLAWYWVGLGGEESTLYTYTIISRISGTTWTAVLVFLLAQLFAKPSPCVQGLGKPVTALAQPLRAEAGLAGSPIRPAGLLIMPINLLLLVWAGIFGKEIETTASLVATWWFWVHISSGGLAYGFVLIAAAVGLLYLLKESRASSATTISGELSELKVLDNLNYHFIALGFIALTIMIISGSLWANQVHGRYWGWDPIEVQSLISWLIYAIWLHLRLTYGWRGKKLAWYSLFALIVVGINLAGVPFLEKAFHSGFRIQH